MRCQQFSIKETLSDPFGGFVSLDARLTVYLVENTLETDASRLHPMVLICPGGGYTMTSDREAEPVALAFLAQGIHANLNSMASLASLTTVVGKNGSKVCR